VLSLLKNRGDSPRNNEGRSTRRLGCGRIVRTSKAFEHDLRRATADIPIVADDPEDRARAHAGLNA